jgi:tRNA (cytidine/uridine-2'-O-)-methyltransferase
MPLNIVLVEPEIPQNTGNIARTCAATGVVLHLVEPLGFSIDEKQVRRAGLDYWDLLDLKTYASLDEFFEKNANGHFFFASTKSKSVHSDVAYKEDSYILFGKESAGLPEVLLKKYYDQCIRIPMKSDARSLNLSNSVAIIVYEALRQLDYPNLKDDGELTGRYRQGL